MLLLNSRTCSELCKLKLSHPSACTNSQFDWSFQMTITITTLLPLQAINISPLNPLIRLRRIKSHEFQDCRWENTWRVTRCCAGGQLTNILKKDTWNCINFVWSVNCLAQNYSSERQTKMLHYISSGNKIIFKNKVKIQYSPTADSKWLFLMLVCRSADKTER